MENCIIYKNAKVVYYNYGDGAKTLVLLHGFLENSKMWNFLMNDTFKQFKIITIDLLGHGKSDCLGYVHTMEEIAETVYEILQKEKVAKASFIGHSMGGYVALAFAEKFPRHVGKLCLLNSTSSPDSEERKKIRDRAIAMAKSNYEMLISMSIANLFAPEVREDLQQEIEACKKEALQTTVQGYIACSEGMKLRKNREEILATASFNTLIITGKNDPILPLASVEREAKKTNTVLITLSNGHMSHIENQQELLTSLKEFCWS